MRWHNGRSRRSRNLYPENALKGSVTKKDEGAAHSIQARRSLLQSKAEYIRADQFCHPHFSLAKRRRTIHSEWTEESQSWASPLSGLRGFVPVRAVGCFTKPRNNRQISTGNIYFLTRGVVLLSERSRMPGVSPARGSPVFIVRHSGLIICKVEEFILKRCSAKSA